MKLIIDTQKLYQWIRATYSLNWRTRYRFQDAITNRKCREQMTKQPTGLCSGCGKTMYNGLDVCSLDCFDVIEIQYAGY